MAERQTGAQNPNILQVILDMNPRQKALAGTLFGLGGAAALVAAFRNEKFRELLKEAGDATRDFAEETGKDVWEVLKQEIPGLAERATQRFGVNVANPFVGSLANELHGQNPLGDAISELFNVWRRSRGPHPLAQRVRIEQE